MCLNYIQRSDSDTNPDSESLNMQPKQSFYSKITFEKVSL